MSRGAPNYQTGAPNPFEDLVDDDALYGQLQKEVTGAVKQFASNTSTLVKLVGSVKSGRQDAELRSRVHDLIDQNKQLAKKTSAELKRMAGMRSADAREQQARRAAQSKLTQDFQTWMQKFQEVATLDLNKERREVQDSARPGPSPQKGSGAFPGLGYDEDDDRKGGSGVGGTTGGWDERAALNQHDQRRQAQLEQEQNDFDLEIARERNREIKQIEQAVEEVAEIFQDLGAMVNEQGILVDNIESNISSAVEATSTGVVQLEGAEEYQIKARKRCVCITVIVVIAVAVIIVVILFALKII